MSNGDVRLARYDHLHAEALRWRGLVWTVGPLVWAAYSVVLFSSKECTIVQIPSWTIFAVALIATVYYAYFEVKIVVTEDCYRKLGEELGLSKGFANDQQDFLRLVVGSIAHVVAIWAPVFLILWKW